MTPVDELLPPGVLAKVKAEALKETPHGQAKLEEIEREADAAELREMEQRDREARIQRLVEAGVPKRIRRQLLSGAVDDTTAVSRMREWAASGSWCLVLSATKGAGKSFAAGLWLWDSGYGSGPRSLKDPSRTLPRWWPASELMCLDGYGDEYRQVCQMHGPLVVDDLGCEYGDAKGYFNQRLDRLIDARYREELPTLITTNLSAREFKDRYQERVADRIREGGVFFGFRTTSMRRSA